MTAKYSSEQNTSSKLNQKVLDDLLWSLKAHKLIEEVNSDGNKSLKLKVEPDSYNAVVEIAHAHNTHIYQYEISSSFVSVEIRPSNLNYSGENTLRTRGDSYIVSIPSEVIKNSPISYESNTEFYTRDNEFLMISRKHILNTEQDNAGNWVYRGCNIIRRSGSSYTVAIPPDVVRKTSFETGTNAIFYSNPQLARVKDKNWVSSYTRTFSSHG